VVEEDHGVLLAARVDTSDVRRETSEVGGTTDFKPLWSWHGASDTVELFEPEL
jgi:hypothetical protein